MSSSPRSPLVSASWLLRALRGSEKPVVCLDSTWFLANSPYSAENFGHGHPTAEQAWIAKRLPRSAFFDIDKCADTSKPGLAHMLPSKSRFEEYMTQLKVGNDHTIVCYDKIGIFSAPRLWFTLQYFGHQDSFVLDGGFPAWEREGGEVLGADAEPLPAAAPYTVAAGFPNTEMVASIYDVVANAGKSAKTGKLQHVDTRGAGRFTGEAAEPREGMASGHVPGSVNVPFPELTDPETKQLRSAHELQAIFQKQNFDAEKPFIVSCGSGLTACTLALATRVAGSSSEFKLYDGSWSEYGAQEGVPVEKGA